MGTQADSQNKGTPSRLLVIATSIVVLAFCVLVGRYWHPYYGFTSLLQIDETDLPIAIHEIREHPIFIYAGANGYDADTYSQIAFHPFLRDPELARAISNLPYRARHILPGLIAWTLSDGNPHRIANVYSTLNIALWFILALLLWKILKVHDWRSWYAWTGFMFSAGVLFTVRLALTDLLAVTLLAASLLALERSRPRFALGILAVAGLARETILTGIVAFWNGPWIGANAWRKNLPRLAVAVVPLAAWMAYVRWVAGPSPEGFGNLTWPVYGYLQKWSDTLKGYDPATPYLWLNTTTLLALVALTVQVVYLLGCPQKNDPWWRVGILGVAMMALFSKAVWEGHPGAAVRLLLPMSLAFTVLVVRRRASWSWIILGNLSLFSGLLAFQHPSREPREVGAGRIKSMSYILRMGPDSYLTERTWKHTWDWSSKSADLSIQIQPPTQSVYNLHFGIRAATPRRIEVKQDGVLLWKGLVGTKRQEIDLSGVISGAIPVHFESSEPPLAEGANGAGRLLGFAVYDPFLD